MGADMELDEQKLDECALAILSLTIHDAGYGMRAWKGLDWNLMNRLYEKGWIHDPKGKAKSVAFTEEGVGRAEEFLRLHFGHGS